ncbi:MAG: transglutaminase TgpA family protein [Blastocatellia bacterium]
MSFEKLFKILSYAAVFCGFFSLWVSGTFGIAGTAIFFAVMIAAWFLEGKRWQVSERLGTVLIVLAIPVYYLLWRWRFFDFNNSETMLAGILARLILTLTAIKLLQKKSERDWIFLYIMSFFEVLLAAGLSISALYLVSFVGYVFVMVCTIILFEIKKTDRQIEEKATVKLKQDGGSRLSFVPVRRIPVIAFALLAFVILLGLPMFFMLPRVGGAGIGGGSGGIATYSGFSDSVKLGGIGRIQENDQVVMRVRMENNDQIRGNLRWRGVALDTFDNQSWSRTKSAFREARTRNENNLILLDYASGRDSLTLQTIYLEPLDTPVVFGLSLIVGIQGNFPMLFKDTHGSISFQRSGERITYKALSDTVLPPIEELRADGNFYDSDYGNYLQLPPKMDERIAVLAEQIAANSTNRYDTAKAVESHLQNSYGYTLEQKAGGSEPLADFLFNVREGHCEYFATAMAIMLRTQGIATRVVNGFQQGEYNETANVFVVRQREAHSWVEVYFPESNVWVPFDPTPFAGRDSATVSAGLTAKFGKYFEALEMFWIQYFVAFDNQEQRSLFTSIRRSVSDYQSKTSSWIDYVQQSLSKWWSDVRGDRGLESSVVAIVWGVGYLLTAFFGALLFVWLYRKALKWKVWQWFIDRLYHKRRDSVVEFYDRMQRVLANKGFTREPHQTPLEFAFAVGVPEAVKITEKYNRVRFGEMLLSRDESAEIENWLEEISTAKTQRSGEKS